MLHVYGQGGVTGCDVPMFAGARLFGTPAGAQMTVTADFNHDGFTDVAVLNSSVVSILLGNGDGTFQAAVNYPAGPNPLWVGVADFNGDGNPDLAIAASGGTNILLGTGDGRFRPPTFINTLIVAAIGDFNGDGKPDLTDGLGIALGKGDGTFQAVVRNMHCLRSITSRSKISMGTANST